MIFERETEAGLLHLASNGLTVECNFEMGDWLSYVSAGRDATHATRRTVKRDVADGWRSTTHRIDLAAGSYEVSQTERIDGNAVDRQLTVVPVTKALLGDVVIRFSIPDAEDMTATIDGNTFDHEGRNSYHQYGTDSAGIEGRRGRFDVRAMDCSIPSGMDLVTYVRDEPGGAWVVHVRALAQDGDDGVLRLYRGGVTHFPALDEIVSRIPPLADRLRYLRERSSFPSGLIPVQFGERVRLSPSSELRLHARGEFTDD